MADTEQKIEHALIEIAKSKDVDKITVKDITEYAGISRRTFYLHFHDLPDLMGAILRQATREMIERSLAAEQPCDILRLFVNEMDRGYITLKKVLDSRFRAGAERQLLGAVNEIVSAVFHEKYKLENLSREETAFLVDTSSCMILTYLLEHFEKQDVAKEEICGRFLWLIDTLVRREPVSF